MDIYAQLKKLNLVSWPTLLVGFKNELISQQDIEDYAVQLLQEYEAPNLSISLLASARDYSEHEILNMIESQLDISKVEQDVEMDKLRLAALISIRVLSKPH
jgi:hypothetical protein